MALIIPFPTKGGIREASVIDSRGGGQWSGSMTRLRVLQPLNVVLTAPEGTALVALEPGEFVSLDDVESEFWTRIGVAEIKEAA